MMLGLSLLYIKAVLMAGKAHKLGCPKIVLDHMRVYVCALGFPHHWLFKGLHTQGNFVVLQKL